MRVLCYINHFFGQNPDFLGKSSIREGMNVREISKRAEDRKKYVEQVIAAMKSIGNADVKVCGIEGNSLVPLDIAFDNIKEKPLTLIYESLNHMTRFIDEYDYFINLEDDVLIPEDVLANIVAFDKESLINEVFLPNRLERFPDGNLYCVDVMAIPGWTQQRKKFKGADLRVALNPHSALVILSREKLRFAMNYVDSKFRGKLLHNELDSAFAYFHAPFALFRSEDINFHWVTHLDKWYYSPDELMYTNPWAGRFKSIKATDFIPPVLVRIYLFLTRRIPFGNQGEKK